MKSIKVDILNPKAIKLLKDLEALNLIAIHENSTNKFEEVLKRLRSQSDSAPTLEEITREVEIVRAERYSNS